MYIMCYSLDYITYNTLHRVYTERNSISKANHCYYIQNVSELYDG